MLIEKYTDPDILHKYEFYNYGHALEILYDAFPDEWNEIQDCLKKLKLTMADIRKAGGNESPIPKNLMMFYILMDGGKYGSVVILL